jgi:hypothetical protein
MQNSDQDQPPDQTGPDSLNDVKSLLKQKSKELLFAQPAKISFLQQEIQKLRVVYRIYREIEDNIVDDDLYKEMNLLNRMTTGKDLEGDAERRDADLAIERAATTLREKHGLELGSANRIARIIGTVAGRRDIVGELSGDEPEPVDPARLE